MLLLWAEIYLTEIQNLLLVRMIHAIRKELMLVWKFIVSKMAFDPLIW